MERGCPAGDDQVLVSLVARAWAAFTVARPWTDERGVVVE